MSWLLPPLPPKFSAALRDVTAKRPESRMAAAERLGHAEGEEREPALEGLRALIKDPHPGVRATAMAAVGLLGDESLLVEVIAGLADPFPEVREFAAMAAAQIGGDQALHALRKALTHSAAEVRFQAVAAIAELDQEHAGRDLIPLLSDPDPEVRAQVLSALGNLEQKLLSGHFAGALDDVAPPVRLEAALALASVEDARGESVLLEALRDRVRATEVAQALVRIGSQKARESLLQIAQSWLAAPDLRAVTAAALARLGDPRGVHALRKIVRGLRSDARSYAVELARDLPLNSETEELVRDLARLAARPRGTDLMVLVSTLSAYGARSPEARLALEKLAARRDEIGQAAREAASRPAAGSNDLPSA